MKPEILEKLPEFLETLGLSDEPVGIFFTETMPGNALTPAPLPL